MANLPNNYYSEEEWKKMLDNLRNIPAMKWDWDLGKVDATEFELDEDGITPLGYKVLVYIPNLCPWYISPNFIESIKWGNRGVWENHKIRAHFTPNLSGPEGIHGTKTLKDLEPWWVKYVDDIRPQFRYTPYKPTFVVFKIALWGVIVETEKGFRAEYAKIVEKILEE